MAEVRLLLDDPSFRRWVDLSLEALGLAREEIDSLNVYPVPDGDTGTNLYLTFERAAQEVAQSAPGRVADTARALARGALLGARGNSGVIVSQLLRGLADELAESAAAAPALDQEDGVSGGVVAAAFERAANLAYAAVERPVEGTILSVARAAAQGALAVGPRDVPSVVIAAAESAREALTRTPDQLEVLRRAGVVDAGGRGFVVLLDAMTQTLTGRRPPRSVTRFEPAVAEGTAAPADPADPALNGHGAGGPSFEVMFMLESDDQSVIRLRSSLSALGDSLVVVGGDPLWNVHVHVDDAGAAVEAAIAAGRPSGIRITHLASAGALRLSGHDELLERAVVVVAHGPGIGRLLEDGGSTVVVAQPRQRPSTAELLEGIHRAGAREVVLLPSDKDTLQVAEAAAAEARDEGVHVAVIPSRSVVQSLAAVAVHDAARSFGDDVVAMTRAAGATRYGAVTIALREAMTSAGICHEGDVLGLANGDIVEIGSDVGEVAIRVVDRLCTGGSELVTLVEGSDCDDALRQVVGAHLRATYRSLDVESHWGGQPFWPLIIGVE